MPPVPDRLAAVLADRYRIERELGAGGMATVYLAEDLKHHRQVAVKVLRPELVASIGADRFLREIEVTAHLQHPHILALYDSGQADGFLYYVMPYVPGDSLRARLQQEGQLPVADALRITRGVAAALGHAHQHGIVHRDIKPENILLAGGEPVVADFGIARALVEASGSALTSTGLTIGTPTYMSPEQASAAKLDGRSDLYSLGCVLYEMLAGEPPYTGSTAQVITARKLQEPMPSLRVVRSSVPAGVEEVVRQALAIAPADRYATAEELIGALDRAVSGPQGATGVTMARSAQATRALWIWRIATVALAVLSVALLWLWRGARAPTETPKPAVVVRFTLPLPAPLPGELADAERRFDEVVFSPNGRLIAATLTGTGAAQPIYLRDLATDEFRPVPGTEGGVTPFFSPDSEWLAYYLVTETRVMRIRLAGGPAQEVCRCFLFGDSRSSWLAGDTIIVPSADPYELGAVPASGGKVRAVGIKPDSTVGEDIQGGAVLTPNGRYLLFQRTHHDESSSIWLLDRRTGAQRRLIEGGQNPAFLGSDLLVFSRPWGFPLPGTFMVARFDPERGVVVGEPAAVSGPESRHSGFGLSAAGDLVYRDDGEPPKFATELLEVDRTGQVSRTTDMGRVWSIRLSPDGRRVAYSEPLSPSSPANAIWVRDLNTGSSTRLTDERGSAYWPAWSPDGRSIAYISTRRGEHRFQIYLIPADGSTEPRQLTQWDLPYAHPQSWTPDGRTLVIQAPVDSARKSDLLTLDVAPGSVPVPLLATPASEIHGVVSPDGRWLAYASDQSGAWEVYLQPFRRPGGAVKISTGGGWAPLWRADGRELFYLSKDKEVWASPMMEGVSGRPRLLFSGPPFQSSELGITYGLLPNGGFLLARNQVPAGKPKITVVLGWKAVALRALAATRPQAR